MCQKLLNNTLYVKIFVNKLIYFVFTFSHKVVKYKHINDFGGSYNYGKFNIQAVRTRGKIENA